MYMYLWNTDIEMYGFFNTMSQIFVFIFNLIFWSKKSKILGRGSSLLAKAFSRKDVKKQQVASVFFTLTEILFITYMQYVLAGSFNRYFGDWVGTGFNYYGLALFSPILVSLSCFLLGIDIFKQMDLITPAYPFGLIFVKLACFCQGCCKGMVCPSFGLYNNLTRQIEFPVQLVEMTLAAIIFVFLMCNRKKFKEGTMFPIYLIIYSATRFFSEFLRQEENVFFILKKYHLLCLMGIVVGLLELFIVNKYKDKIQKYCSLYFDFIEKTFNKIVKH